MVVKCCDDILGIYAPLAVSSIMHAVNYNIRVTVIRISWNIVEEHTKLQPSCVACDAWSGGLELEANSVTACGRAG
eukprot:2800688-Pleurochrysis_carterae.AAC.7